MTTLKFIPYLMAVAGGWIGWALGRPLNLMTAYVLGVIGLASGLYFGRRLVKRVLGEI
jgi:hypothetical protein